MKSERLSGQGVANAFVGHRVIRADYGVVLELADSSYGILATLHRPETDEEIQALTESTP